ncbi:hypothetical protein [Amycolatopsis thermoflava]|uniref:hypothetical protein n=1 Tax=Amycolatopsis thermoflava TaxID=84480 RepID=UPI00040D337D|nr:hypothetical protein [Amycolatopsis thermoflava]
MRGEPEHARPGRQLQAAEWINDEHQARDRWFGERPASQGIEGYVIKPQLGRVPLKGVGSWTEERYGQVVLARWSRPPMSYFTDAGLAGLSALLDRCEAEGIGALVLAGGVPGRFITHFDADEVLNGQRVMDPVTAPVAARSRRPSRCDCTPFPFP